MALHDVSINREQLNEQFAHMAASNEQAADTAAASPAIGNPDPVPVDTNWAPIGKMASTMLAKGITPNWEVPPDTQADFADALADCLEQLFPGGFENIDNWSPWAKLAFASACWMQCGMDFETMTFKPLREPLEDDSEPPAPPAFNTGGSPPNHASQAGYSNVTPFTTATSDDE